MFVKLRLSCVDPKMSAGVAILSLNNIPALGGGGGSASSTSWSTPEVATEKSILFIYSIGKCSSQSHAWKQISHQLMTSAEFSLLQFVVARFHGIGMMALLLVCEAQASHAQRTHTPGATSRGNKEHTRFYIRDPLHVPFTTHLKSKSSRWLFHDWIVYHSMHSCWRCE